MKISLINTGGFFYISFLMITKVSQENPTYRVSILKPDIEMLVAK